MNIPKYMVDVQNILALEMPPNVEGRYLLGFSLSFCVRDIVQGWLLPNGKPIREKDVLFIQTGCNPRRKSKKDFDAIISQYCRTYWREFPEEAKAVVFRLMHPSDSADGPRIGWVNAYRKNPIRIGMRHWVDYRAFMLTSMPPAQVEAARERLEAYRCECAATVPSQAD